MASLRLKITGMTCGHCRHTVEQAIKDVTGVYGVTVDLTAGAADVDFDERRTAPEVLMAAVASAGYGAQVESDP